MEIPRREPLPQRESTTSQNWVWIGFQIAIGFMLASLLIGLPIALLIAGSFTHALKLTFAGQPLN